VHPLYAGLSPAQQMEVNPKPYTLNPKPYTLSPTPYTLRPKLHENTLSPKS